MNTPKHIGIIMDGNGRWAEAQGLSRSSGHQAGANNARAIIAAAAKKHVRHLTLFAFSTENWRRPASEVNAIFSVLEFFLREEALSLRREGIQLSTIGDRSRLPPSLQEALDETTKIANRNERMELVLALDYGARNELVRLTRALVHEQVPADLIDEEFISERLRANRPDPDLIIRTGGERRLSNFLLWQAAYSELYFAEQNWPDFHEPNLQQAIDWFAHRERRYGALLDPALEGLRWPPSIATPTKLPLPSPRSDVTA